MVGLPTLDRPIGVRIPALQLRRERQSTSLFFCLAAPGYRKKRTFVPKQRSLHRRSKPNQEHHTALPPSTRHHSRCALFGWSAAILFVAIIGAILGYAYLPASFSPFARIPLGAFLGILVMVLLLATITHPEGAGEAIIEMAVEGCIEGCFSLMLVLFMVIAAVVGGVLVWHVLL